ncbi:hypothetical protein D3C78_1538240 [compost metagenome]
MVAGLVFITLGEALEDVALGIGDQMARIAEDIGEIGDADRLEVTRREARAGNDDINGADLQALIDIGFLAKLRSRKDIDLVTTVGALGDFFCGPDRIRVERLGGFVNMGPFQRGLCLRRQSGKQDGGCCAHQSRQSDFHS